MIRNSLERDEGALVLSFNGWLFEGYEDAKTALMGTIIDEIASRQTIISKATERGRGLVVKLLKKINIFRCLSVAGRAAMAF